MTRVTRRTFCALAVPLLVPPLEAQSPAATVPASARGNPFTIPTADTLNRIRDVMDISATPGLGAVLVQAGGVTWIQHVGVADASTGVAVSEDTIWPAASLGKPVAALAALTLVGEGRLDIDRPMWDYLPGYTADDARARLITARHVLSHSSGLPNWRTRPGQALTPQFEPGARFQYSGEGYYYLQSVIESLTGMGFEQVMRERIFGPLRMRQSTYARPDVPARVVTGHDRGVVQPAETRPDDSRAALPVFTIPNAAASLVTTPADYARFLAAAMDPDGPVPLTPGLRQQMFAQQTPLNRALGWGLGWGVERLHPSTPTAVPDYAWHWGDNGNWKNFVLAHPASRSALAIFTNGNRGLNVAQRLVSATTGEDHPAFQWL